MKVSATFWIPLAALLSAVISAGSVMLTQRFTQKSADRRADIERQSRDDRDRELWTREDAHRSYEYRRDTYGAFLALFYQHLHEIEHWYVREDREPPAPDALADLYERGTLIRICGPRAISDAAGEMWDWMSVEYWKDRTAASHQEQPDRLIRRYLSLVRQDLAVLDAAPSPPARG
ncbi:hypothetical protein [Nocardia sp. NPDC127526]|uniref:hypothetical protein n=1 Tax=Nocardia sp. NPDC127526 TaxID=3345393 RepID=UPI0036303BDE